MRYVYAKERMVKFVDGVPRVIAYGEQFPADDPIVRSSPKDFDERVEQATAAPGERRK